MSSKNVRSPPSLSKCKRYDGWIKLVKIWRSCTDISKSCQGPELLLSLEGEAQDAALEVAEDEIVQDDGFDKIISLLDKLFKRDSTVTKYQALELFETYRRTESTSIRDFLNEFEKRYYKTKSHGTVMSDDILAYRLLKAANLTPHHEELIKATLTDLKYGLRKDQLKNLQ